MESDIGKTPQTPPDYEAVHMCPKCTYAVNLERLDMEVITTGIMVCPICNHTGPVEITIIDLSGSSGPDLVRN